MSHAKNFLLSLRYFPASVLFCLLLFILQLTVFFGSYKTLKSVSKFFKRIPGLFAMPLNNEKVYNDLSRLLGIVARRFPFNPKCLVRALSLQAVLRIYGLRSELKIGAKDEGEFFAHAWLEADFIPVEKNDRQGCSDFVASGSSHSLEIV